MPPSRLTRSQNLRCASVTAAASTARGPTVRSEMKPRYTQPLARSTAFGQGRFVTPGFAAAVPAPSRPPSSHAAIDPPSRPASSPTTINCLFIGLPGRPHRTSNDYGAPARIIADGRGDAPRVPERLRLVFGHLTT